MSKRDKQLKPFVDKLKKKSLERLKSKALKEHGGRETLTMSNVEKGPFYDTLQMLKNAGYDKTNRPPEMDEIT